MENMATCLKVFYVPWPPFVKEGAQTGIFVDVLKIMQERLKFCYTIHLQEDLLWGSKRSDGTFDGMIGTLVRREGDVALGPFGLNLDRFRVVGYSEHVLFTDYNVIYSRPVFGPDILAFVKPFSIEVWGVLLFSLLAFNSFLFIIKWAYEKTIKKLLSDDNGSFGETRAPEWLWAFMILLGQSMAVVPRESGVQNTVLLWMITTLIVGSLYKSNLNALLIAPKVKIPFDSVEGLALQSQYKWQYPASSLSSNALKASYENDPSSSLGQVYIKAFSASPSPKAGFQFVTQPKSALINARFATISMTADDFSKKGFCRLAVTTYGFLSTPFAYTLQDNSTLKKPFNNIIYRLRESGIISKLSEIQNSTHCLKKPGTEGTAVLRPLVIEDFLGVFSIFAGGIVLSLLAFFLEIIIHRLQGQRYITNSALSTNASIRGT